MNSSPKKRVALLLLAALMLFLFNAPILRLANRVVLFLGLPILFVYLFSVWILCIILLMCITASTHSKRKAGDE